MFLMLSHFIDLLFRSGETMPSRVGSNWGGVFFTLVIFALTEFLLWKWGEKSNRWGRNAAIGLGVVFVGWFGLFLVSAFLTVYDDHQNLAGAARRIKSESQIATKGCEARIRAVSQPLKENLIAEGTANAVKDGINKTLEKQNRDEQVLIAGCQSEAIKRLIPAPFDETILLLDSVTEGSPQVTITRYLLLANQTTNHKRIQATCLSPIDSVTLPHPNGFENAALAQYSPNLFQINTELWNANAPLMIRVVSHSDNPNCLFKTY